MFSVVAFDRRGPGKHHGEAAGERTWSNKCWTTSGELARLARGSDYQTSLQRIIDLHAVHGRMFTSFQYEPIGFDTDQGGKSLPALPMFLTGVYRLLLGFV